MTEVTSDLMAIAEVLVPDIGRRDAYLVRGQFHDVVIVDGGVAIRIARRAEAARQLPRRADLLVALAAMDLPFEVPTPITEVTKVGDRQAVATTWVPGTAAPRGTGDPAELGALLQALAAVPLSEVAPLLDVPHAYAGGARWFTLMTDEVIPRLDRGVRDEARRRIDAAADLPAVEPSLVHGDLAGDNLRWSADGRLLGVLDWDLAQPFDPAVDAACLAWHGWNNVRTAVDDGTYRRARVWQRTFGIEQVGAAIENGEPADVIDHYVARASADLAADGALSG